MRLEVESWSLRAQLCMHAVNMRPRPFSCPGRACTVPQVWTVKWGKIWTGSCAFPYKCHAERADLCDALLPAIASSAHPRRRQFKQEGPFWGRQYLFWHGQRPLTLIHEVFSPSLQRFLGPLTPEP